MKIPGSILERNIVANFVGKVWAVALYIFLVPFYVKQLGIEAYGLIGFFITISTTLICFDLGLSITANRQIALYSAQANREQDVRDLVRTLEILYWSIAVFIGVGLIVLAPWIAEKWFHASHLSTQTLHGAITYMGLALMLQWPFSLYSGALSGLQRQVLLNLFGIIVSSVQAIGISFILLKISKSIEVFFVWQAFISVTQTLIAAVLLWRLLPESMAPPKFKRKILVSLLPFTSGMAGIAIAGVLLSQMDKMILSRILSLEMFGYYTLASTLAGAPLVFIGPLFNALFPRLTSFVAVGNSADISNLYHHTTQILASVILPVAVFVALFSSEVTFLWTGDHQVAKHVASLASFLVLGTALNGLMTMPYALQLAYGWTSIAFGLCIFLIVLTIPTIIILTSYYGAVGGAAYWLILNGIYMIVGVPLTHKRLLKGELCRWFLKDIAPALLGTILILAPARYILQESPNRITELAILAAVLFLTYACSFLFTPLSRRWILSYFLSNANRPKVYK